MAVDSNQVQAKVNSPAQSPMRLLALSALLSFMIALACGASGVLVPAAAAHIAFAVGIVPLVFGAMLHFVPVLTRSGEPHPFFRAMPFVSQAIGLLAVSAFQGWSPRWVLHLAAILDCIGAAALFSWMIDRSQRCLGSPHPGWRWYAASLGTLVLTLLAVPAMDSEYGRAARLVHMHLNTLGFVGLAALGTLPVLLPTVLGQSDLKAGWWLQKWWPRMYAGTLVMGLGTMIHPGVAAAGAAVLLFSAVDLGLRWLRAFSAARLWQDGAAVLLSGAALGYCLLLVFGALHGFGVIAARPTIAAFACLFLLPLVTGALTQLLPVWRFPGPRSDQRDVLRSRLAWGGQVRALCFLVGGVACAVDQLPVGICFAVAGLLAFAVVLLRPLR